MDIKIFGQSIPNIPWQDRKEGDDSVIWRYDNNPVIDWNPTKNIARIFNSAVLPYEGKFVAALRAEYRNGKPHIHIGWSNDGLNWEINEEKINWVDEQGNPYEPAYGYDPRLVQIEDTYYIIWCTDFGGASLGLGSTKDFKTFVRHENPFIPFNRNGVLFPRKVNDKYLLLSRPSDSGHTPFGDVFLSESPDLVHWGRHRKVMSRGGSGWWQSTKIGAGPAPIETSEGWLMFYHGVTGTCNGLVYSCGAVILDKENPAKVLYRTRDYLLTPENDYETRGFVPNVIFPVASMCDADTGRIALYYGAADTYVSLAFTTVDELVKHIKENSELVNGDGEEVR